MAEALSPREVVRVAVHTNRVRAALLRLVDQAWVPPCHWAMVTSRGLFIGGLN